METKNLWLYLDDEDPTAAYDCVEDLCMMVIRNPPGFTLSFDPNIQLLVEEQKVNYMQEGKGTPMADFELYDGDMPAVIERNGKQYRVRLMTWDRNKHRQDWFLLRDRDRRHSFSSLTSTLYSGNSGRA